MVAMKIKLIPFGQIVRLCICGAAFAFVYAFTEWIMTLPPTPTVVDKAESYLKECAENTARLGRATMPKSMDDVLREAE